MTNVRSVYRNPSLSSTIHFILSYFGHSFQKIVCVYAKILYFEWRMTHSRDIIEIAKKWYREKLVWVAGEDTEGGVLNPLKIPFNMFDMMNIAEVIHHHHRFVYVVRLSECMCDYGRESVLEWMWLSSSSASSASPSLAIIFIRLSIRSHRDRNHWEILCETLHSSWKASNTYTFIAAVDLFDVSVRVRVRLSTSCCVWCMLFSFRESSYVIVCFVHTYHVRHDDFLYFIMITVIMARLGLCFVPIRLFG